MKKNQRIVITRAQNGFKVDIENPPLHEWNIEFVYNLYSDLIRDMIDFLKIVEKEEEEEEEEEHKGAYDEDEDY